MALIDKYKARLSAENLARLEEWVEIAWNAHWKRLSPKSNSKVKFKEYVLRDNKPDNELRIIFVAIQQQRKMWERQSRIEKVVGIPNLSSWYNAGRWDDDITSDNPERPVTQLKTCTVEGCNNDVHGPAYDKCCDHLATVGHIQAMREAYVRTGVDRKSPTFVQDCRDYCRQRLNIMTSKGEI